MIKNILKILLITGFIVNVIFAQELYFARSHSEDGKPIEANGFWKIKPWGTTIEILFNNGGKLINDDLLYIFIDKKSDGTYQPFDSKAITLENQRSWFFHPYKFVEEGEYEISVVTSKNEKLVSGKLSLKMEDTHSLSGVRSNMYYTYAKIVFCEYIISNKAYGEKEDVSLSKDNGEITVQLTLDRKLDTEIIIVDIWKKGIRSFEYDQHVETKRYKVDPEWPDTYFKYKFIQPGDFKISISNANDILIKERNIKVLN